MEETAAQRESTQQPSGMMRRREGGATKGRREAMRQPADAARRREGGVTRGREGRATIGDSVLFYGGNAAAVPQGELVDPSWRIEAIHLKQLSSRH